jgi:hypothetical protein
MHLPLALRWDRRNHPRYQLGSLPFLSAIASTGFAACLAMTLSAAPLHAQEAPVPLGQAVIRSISPATLLQFVPFGGDSNVDAADIDGTGTPPSATDRTPSPNCDMIMPWPRLTQDKGAIVAQVEPGFNEGGFSKPWGPQHEFGLALGSTAPAFIASGRCITMAIPNPGSGFSRAPTQKGTRNPGNWKVSQSDLFYQFTKFINTELTANPNIAPSLPGSVRLRQ